MMSTSGEKDPGPGESAAIAPAATGRRLFPPWLPSFLVAAVGGALFGYDIGGVSSAIRILGTGMSDLGALDPLQLGAVASASLVGAMAAAALLIAVGDKQVGRQTELRTAGFLYAAGTVLQACAPSFPLLLAGRVVYGLGIGTAMHVAPLYIAETSPTALRGRLVSLKEAAIVAGIVLGYLAGPLVESTGDWRAIFAAAGLLVAPMLVLAFVVPESPRWLVLQGRSEDATASLVRGQGLDTAAAQQQVQQMTALTSSKDPDAPVAASWTQLIATAANRRALVVGVGLVLFQQLSGQPSVLYFANRIFEAAGLGFEAAVGVGLFKLAMTLVSVQLVENPRWGRRPLLLVGTAGMLLSLVGLSLLFLVYPTPPPFLVLGCVVAFVGGYQIGFGPVTWLILSEVFPLGIRSAAVSVGALVNFGSNVVVALLFDYERVRLGEAALFTQFAVVALLALWFEYRLVPETRGLSLEEIEAQLTKDSAGGDWFSPPGPP